VGRGGKRGSARLDALAAAALIPGAALADVATDGTLGRKVRLTGRQVEVGADLGRVRGGNLFHSFGRFDVPGEGRVTFTGPAGLDNVVARVTGGEPSSIDGTLASRVPGADLYLVNPSGILFGPGARLDVPGSFHASTADELRLQDGTVFSASDPGRGGLSVARPEAFGFLGGRPGAVTLDRGTLEVLAGQALSLVGGNVEVAGGGLRAPGGRLALSAFGGLGEHVIATGGATGDPSANVRVTGRASASTTGDGGGTVLIRGGRLDLEDRSAILAGNTGPSDAPGGIAVEADEVTVGSDSLVATGALAGGAAGPVTVRAGQVELRAGGRLDSVALASGGTGPITVEAARLTVAGEPRPVGRELAPEVRDLLESATAADLGTLLAVARELAAAATDAAPPDAQAVRLTFARGGLAPPAAGDPEPFTGINAVTLGPASAAPVVVRADEIELRDGLVSSDGFGPGSAGPVTVEAGRRLFVDGTGLLPVSGIVSAASGGGAEGAGRVTVRAGHAEVRGGVIGTSPLGQRGGGTVLVEADRLLLGDGGDARAEPRLATVESSAFSDSGRGGNVTVRAGELEIRAGGVVSTGTFSTATGGAVTVEAGRLLIAGDGRLSLAAIASNAVSYRRLDELTFRVRGGMLSWSARMTVDEGEDDGRGAADPGRADGSGATPARARRAEPAGGLADAGDRQRAGGDEPGRGRPARRRGAPGAARRRGALQCRGARRPPRPARARPAPAAGRGRAGGPGGAGVPRPRPGAGRRVGLDAGRPVRLARGALRQAVPPVQPVAGARAPRPVAAEDPARPPRGRP
jgi:filamentous hemagglutinin family protein